MKRLAIILALLLIPSISFARGGALSPSAGGGPLSPSSVLGVTSGGRDGLLLNYNGHNFDALLSAFGKSKTGSGIARIFFVGDSTTSGIGAGTRAYSFPSQFAQILSSQGYNVSTNVVFTSGDGSNDPTLYGGMITKGSSWGTSVSSAGGYTWAAGTSTDALVFSPVGDVDTFELYYLRTSGSNTLSYQVDSGSTTNINTYSSQNTIGRTIISAGSVGTHTLSIKEVAGNVFVLGFAAYDSTKTPVVIYNMGWSGSTTAGWSSTTYGYSPGNALAQASVEHDFTFINLGINDWNHGISVQNYADNLQTIITSAKVSGGVAGSNNVAIITPQSSNPNYGGSVPFITQQSYVDASIAVAKKNNVPVINGFNYMGPYSTATSNGWMNDSYHPNMNGYYQWAQTLCSVVCPSSFRLRNSFSTPGY